MTQPDSWHVALASLRLGSRLVDRIQEGVRAGGFSDVRPMHGFAFMCIAAGDATAGRLASYLGVSKQAAAQLVDRLVRDGYVERVRDPADGRAWLLRLTPTARKVTAAAEQAARAAVDEWRDELPATDRDVFERALLTLTAHVQGVRPTSGG